MGKKLSKLLLSTALLATTAASLTALTQVKKGQALENETRETRNVSALDEKIAQIGNPTIKAFLEYYASQNMTSASSLPMIDDLEADTRIIVIEIDYADTSLPPAIGTSLEHQSMDPKGLSVELLMLMAITLSLILVTIANPQLFRRFEMRSHKS